MSQVYFIDGLHLDLNILDLLIHSQTLGNLKNLKRRTTVNDGTTWSSGNLEMVMTYLDIQSPMDLMEPLTSNFVYGTGAMANDDLDIT